MGNDPYHNMLYIVAYGSNGNAMCLLISLHTGKKYTVLDGVALVCMSVGLIMFTLADSTMQPNFDQTGRGTDCR